MTVVIGAGCSHAPIDRADMQPVDMTLLRPYVFQRASGGPATSDAAASGAEARRAAITALPQRQPYVFSLAGRDGNTPSDRALAALPGNMPPLPGQGSPDQAVHEPSHRLTLAAGLRRDQIDWSIAAPGGTPNVLSELKWRDLEILTVTGQYDIDLSRHWRGRVNAELGTTLAGKNQDSDYAGNNRTLEWSRSNNDADEGTVIDLSLAVGYEKPVWQRGHKRLSLTPWAGYSMHVQNLKMRDGKQTLSVAQPGFPPPAPLGTFDGLDSRYDATWHGPWVGLQGDLQLGERHTLTAQSEYHWANYEATARWNLRQDLAQPESFEHKADGHGVRQMLSWRYQPRRGPAWHLRLGRQKWRTGSGRDQVNVANGQKLFTRLNGVNWRSASVDVGMRYTW